MNCTFRSRTKCGRAYARLLNAQATIQSQTANVKTAEESVGLAQLSADTGYATLLDVLQATIDLTSARSEEIRTKQLYMDAMADLERAVSLKFVDWPESKALPPTAPPETVQPASPLAPQAGRSRRRRLRRQAPDAPPAAPAAPLAITMKPVVFATWLLFSLAGLTRGTEPPPAAQPASPRQDVSLAQCLQIAIEHNFQVRQASTQFLATEGRVISLHAILYPKLQAQALSTPTTLYFQFSTDALQPRDFPPVAHQPIVRRAGPDQLSPNPGGTSSFRSGRPSSMPWAPARRSSYIAIMPTGRPRPSPPRNSFSKPARVQKNTVFSIQVKANLAKRYQADFELQSTQAPSRARYPSGPGFAQVGPAHRRIVGCRALPTRCRRADCHGLAKTAGFEIARVGRNCPPEQAKSRSICKMPIPSSASPPTGPFSRHPSARSTRGGYDLERKYDEPATERAFGSSQLPLSLYVTWQIF